MINPPPRHRFSGAELAPLGSSAAFAVAACLFTLSKERSQAGSLFVMNEPHEPCALPAAGPVPRSRSWAKAGRHAPSRQGMASAMAKTCSENFFRFAPAAVVSAGRSLRDVAFVSGA